MAYTFPFILLKHTPFERSLIDPKTASAFLRYLRGNEVSSDRHRNPARLADWMPKGAFSITTASPALRQSFFRLCRYGSGWGLPCFTSLPVTMTEKSRRKLEIGR